MPEMWFDVRWPDGTEQTCYSPSQVVAEHVSVGAEYPVPEFVDRARTALSIASDRVRAAHGYPCSRAAAALVQIEATASRQPAAPGAPVVVSAIRSTRA